jgi:hypothetical protein
MDIAKDILMQNWFVILIAATFVAYVIHLILTKQWTKLREQAYALMLSAERLYGDDAGKEKFEAVFQSLYFTLIPAWLRPFVTEDAMRKKLQEWYELAKDFLDDGEINESI